MVSPALLRVALLVPAAVFAVMFLRAALRALKAERGRALLRGLGKKALDQQPDEIRLQRLEASQWLKPDAVAALTEPLRRRGFNDVGLFAIDKIPSIKMIFLLNEETRVAAFVLEHPKLPPWIELSVRYEDGTTTAISNRPAIGVARPPFLRRIEAEPGASVDQLYDRLLRERPADGIKKITAESVVPEYEDAYRRGLAWQKRRGISAEEIASAAKRLAQLKKKT